MESESERFDRQVIDLATSGKSEGAIADLLGCTRADVLRALDAYAIAVLSPQSRVRTIATELAKLSSYEEPFLQQARGGCVASGALCVKIAERRATLQGLNAPIRVDPVQLLAVAQVKPTTTDEHERLLENILGQDKRRIRNGGEGYGDWRDEADREEMARREREKADGLSERDGE